VVAGLLVWSGGACGDDDCGPGTPDCGAPITVSWSPGALPEAALVRLCVNDDCNEAHAPYINPDTGALHAPEWEEPLSGDPIAVELELLDESGVVVDTLATEVTPNRSCGCRTVHLEVQGPDALRVPSGRA